MENEQRKFYRALPNNDAFASLGHNFITVGKIKDISLKGLSFLYWSSEELKSDSFQQVDIFLHKSGYHISNVPCRPVYDVAVQSLGNTFTLPIKAKQCGVQFGELTEGQSNQLMAFIEKNTAGAAEAFTYET